MTDPLRPRETDDEPWAPALDRHRSRDIMLLCFAGLVILAILAWVTR